MADNKIQMPSSGGGLVRYFDEFKSKITINPTIFVIFVVLVIIFEIVLYKIS